MNKKIFFDHTYTSDPGHKFHRQLEKRGFRLNKIEVEHPGKLFCRFIMLPRSSDRKKYTYLEFINPKSPKTRRTEPGISFGYSVALERFYRTLVKRGKYKTTFEHKNYMWKTDAKSRLPGWNFVMFPGWALRGIFFWITEYEPGRKRRRRVAPVHPNGVTRHRAFALTLNPAGEKFLSHLLGAKIRSKMTLSCGTELHITKGKRNRVDAVVLECKSLPRFIKKYGADEELIYRGEPAARIKNPAGMWDILLV